jgi:membrane-bound metal-dependent hydrolase YbcI (DUF457 family)
MFPHPFFGSLVFLIFGKIIGFQISAYFLLFGGLMGIVPDILSLGNKLTNNKWAHEHRNGLHHSIFFPFLIFITVLPFHFDWAIIISISILTHPIIDLYGLGWGVKLFYPFSNKIYKIFYKGKIIYVFQNDEEQKQEAKKHGMDDWVKQIYFTGNWYGFYEWACLALFLILLILAYFGLFA